MEPDDKYYYKKKGRDQFKYAGSIFLPLTDILNNTFQTSDLNLQRYIFFFIQMSYFLKITNFLK